MQDDAATRALEIVAQLEQTGALGKGGRLPALLRYLVTEETGGRGDSLKAYAIATVVLGRGRGFDPQQDSIVRVEVARLRRALEYYYATTGREAALKITIPRGTYRPQIAAEAAPTSGPDADLPDFEPPPPAKADRRFPAALMLVALLALAGLGWWALKPTPAIRPVVYSGATPRLVLLPIETGMPEAGALAPGLRAQLAALLAQQPWLAVAVEERFAPSSPMPAKVFTLQSVLEKVDQGYALRALLHNEPEHRLVWSGRYASPALHRNTLDMARAIAADLAKDLGYPLGPMGQAIAARSSETAPEVEDRFLCMINAYRYRRTRDERGSPQEMRQREDTLSCLTRLSARLPDFSQGRAMLALITLDDARAIEGAARDEALDKAAKILRGVPENDRLGRIARMTLAACWGEPAETLGIARTLFEQTPNDAETLAEVANKAGLAALDWDLALKAEDRALSLSPMQHARHTYAHAAKALLAGNYDAALAAISRVPQQGTPRGQAMLLAIAAMADAPLRAQGAAQALSRDGALDQGEILARIDRACWHPSVKAAFRAALEKALIPAKAAP